MELTVTEELVLLMMVSFRVEVLPMATVPKVRVLVAS
jgi:hypothetical protein